MRFIEPGRAKRKICADEVYVCVGTTNNKTPNKKLYRAIDFGIPVTAAQLCRENGIEKIAVISSLVLITAQLFTLKRKVKWNLQF